jgi:hypothetical protein
MQSGGNKTAWFRGKIKVIIDDMTDIDNLDITKLMNKEIHLIVKMRLSGNDYRLIKIINKLKCVELDIA